MKVSLKVREERLIIAGEAYLDVREPPYGELSLENGQNPIEWQKAVWDKAVVGWGNIVDDDAQPIPFNAENKKFFFDHCYSLRLMVRDWYDKIFAERSTDLKN